MESRQSEEEERREAKYSVRKDGNKSGRKNETRRHE